MAESYGTSEYATPEQLAYAWLLDLGMKIGLAALVGTFIVYMSGLLTPHVPLADLPRYWSMNVHDYLQAAQVPIGWGWLDLVGEGDFLNFLPIAFLGGITILCFLRIIPMLIAGGDRVYAGIAVVEVLVLVLAASGILAAGH